MDVQASGNNSSDAPATSSGWRVKLYELESSGSWVDRGVGHVRVELLPSLHPQATHSQVPSLCIVSEDNGSYLLQSKIQSDDLYEKQGDTMILWKEADCSTTIDYAMSFQQPEGCAEIWSEINKVQGEYAQEREYGFAPSFSRTQRIGSQHNDSDSSSLYTLMDDSDVAQSSVYIILPPELNDESVLPAIKHKLDTLHPSQRDYVSTQLLSEESSYFRKLFQIFQSLEDSMKISDLQLMAEIFRSIFLLNDPNIIEFLLMNDEVFKSVAGIFEYDRALKLRGQYRHFLFNVARMTFVVSLSPEVQQACKFLYRLKYVRDIMLHPTIDDPGVSAINSMITFTSVDICCQVMNEKSYIAELFFVISPKFKHSALSPTAATVTEPRKPIHGVLFLRELFMLSKFLQLERRFELYRSFFDEFCDIFGEVIIYLLSGISISLRSNAPHVSDVHVQSENFVERFSNDDAASAGVAVSEILSTISFVYPNIIRQMVLDIAVHPTPPPKPSSSGLEVAVDASWSRNSLLYLIIDLIVNNVEASSIDFLGETMKNLLDFDKFSSASGLFPGTQNGGTGHFQGRSAVGSGPSSPTGGVGSIWGNNKQEKENFLKEFYEYYLFWLLVPFTEVNAHPCQPIPTKFYADRGISFQPEGFIAGDISKFVEQSSLALNTSRRIILDILMVCLSCHSYRIKYFLLHGNYLATLINRCFPTESNNSQRKIKSSVINGSNYSPTEYHPQRTLQLYATKVLKSVLQQKDEFYVKYIIKQDIFKSLFHSFKEICHRDNIITSAIHDLIEFIRNDNHMSLICYLVERYGEICFDKVKHVEVFDKLRIRYDQLMDRHRDGVGTFSNGIEGGEYSSSRSTEFSSNGGDATPIRGTKRQYQSSHINNENRKLQELEDDENYLNQDDDEDEVESQNSYNITKVEDEESVGSGLKRQRSIPSIPYAKPRSPPHYNRKHGTDLDGESILSTSSGSHSSSPSSPTVGDAMSIISQYDDDKDEVDGNEMIENRNNSSGSLSTVIDSIYDEDDLALTRTGSGGSSNEIEATLSVTSASRESTTLSLDVAAMAMSASEEEDDSFFQSLPPLRSDEEDDADEGFFSKRVGQAMHTSTSNFGNFFKKKIQPQIKLNLDQKL